ncbi:MAG: hypothetical protein ACRYFX_19005 [Janthinobacterium lividum]
MSTAARPIRALDSPAGLKVEVLGRDREGYAKVKPVKAGAVSFETPAARLYKLQ